MVLYGWEAVDMSSSDGMPMDGHGIMMMIMGAVWILMIVALILGIAALIKYLRAGRGPRDLK